MLSVVALPTAIGSNQQPPRDVWTASTIHGSPLPPPPLKQVRRFPKLKFKSPLSAECTQTDGRIWIVTRGGKVWSFPDRDDVEEADLFVDLQQSFSDLVPHTNAKAVGSAYGIEFHPDYPQVPYCWISYTLLSKQKQHHLEDGTRLSRFRITFDDRGVPRCDVGSEKILMTWLQGGHNGACLRFGPDGFLYVSAGDGEVPTPPDPRRSGQDVRNRLSTIMRIDVRVDDEGPLYTVPPDNPFVRNSEAHVSGTEIRRSTDDDPTYTRDEALPEIWAYGFRNPWKMNFGPHGQLWVGDVGWELFEMVYNVQPGGNYGWSIMEGPQPVLPNEKRGPTPIFPPALSYSHSEGASVTGGLVYQGSRFPEYRDYYIFGDYETRRIWAAPIVKSPDGRADTLGPVADLVSPSIQIVAFSEDTSRELLLVHFGEGTLYGLDRNTAIDAAESFPRRLSETGLFRNTDHLAPAVGVTPYVINEPLWSDGATAGRVIAVPSPDPLVANPRMVRRPNSSLRQRITFPEESVLARTVSLEDRTGQNVRLETQVLHFDGQHWMPYSYVWNPDQTDATLAPLKGTQLTLSDYGSFEERRSWTVHSQAECRRCHNSFAGEVLGFTLPQLNRPHPSGNGNQLTSFVTTGLLSGAVPDNPGSATTANARAMRASHDESQPLNLRARSYLAANCSHCHQRGGGGTATIDLLFATDLAKTGLLNAPPNQGVFGLSAAAIVSPGAPARSVLYYRMASCGRGRMPHIGSEQVDVAGIELIRQWIESLPSSVPDVTFGSDITSTTGALQWVQKLDEDRVDVATRKKILQQARQADPAIRNLFTRFQPLEHRSRFRTRIDPSRVMALKGNANAGATLFADQRLQCSQCHQVAGRGGKIGPPLDGIGKRLTAISILDSILNPSQKIDPKFAAWTAITAEGRIVSGLLVDRNDGSITLRTTKNDDITIARNDLDELHQQSTSLMPDRLVNELTDQQIADLIAWLTDLKGP